MSIATFLLTICNSKPCLPLKLISRLCNNRLISKYCQHNKDGNFQGFICQKFCTDASASSSSLYNGDNASSGSSQDRSISQPYSEILDTGDHSNVKVPFMIQNIFKSHENPHDIELAINKCKLTITEDLVVQVLLRHNSDWKSALFFFNWASRQKGYCHGWRSYNVILDILGRMKQLKVMQQVFDEVPKERAATVITERTFAILMNRYAAAHKVESAIEVFYKRKDYGFEGHIIAFQTLLMCLCRYKHVEEAEALFLKKQDEFPPVIKSQNIILNGWCVLGNSREAKRFWNDIISSKCKPDLFTYGTFINSLTKSGKLGTAMKLFAAMRKKGCNPDVTICNCIIDALCFKKRIPEALGIFNEMNEPGCLPDVATYNSLIKHLCKIRRMEKVFELLDEMEKRGCLPNARTYSYILKTTRKPEEVSELLHAMERKGCKMNGDTYNLVLNLYVQWNYQEGIHSVWAEMEKKGLGPDQRSYTIMVHGLYDKGNLDQALQYFSEMSLKGMIVEPRTRLLVEAIHLKEGKLAKLDISP
ncbi:hypothetical protein M5K25_023103 [Dendrobium thyrsiflorum]|uniref:Pentatricopeptide repeat-containing protein n=1 Tax=Dendrobium thyrsiflorum TaxID=117978 RepID=A0ABD0UEA2_DENTH